LEVFSLRISKTICGILATGILLFCIAACGESSNSSGNGNNTTGTANDVSNGCVPGIKEINGVRTQNFCGDATATASVSGETWTWKNGKCVQGDGSWFINIGAVVIDTGDKAQEVMKQTNYLGISVTDAKIHDGEYPNLSFTGRYQGKAFIITRGTVTLADNGTKGTFNGSDQIHNLSVEGSFSCK
jgi:hypothetical protein